MWKEILISDCGFNKSPTKLVACNNTDLLYTIMEDIVGFPGAHWWSIRLPMLGTQETSVPSLDWEHRPKQEMTTHSSILAWEIPWTDEPSGLQPMGSQRVKHDWVRPHKHGSQKPKKGWQDRAPSGSSRRESIYLHFSFCRDWKYSFSHSPFYFNFCF